MLRDKLPDPRDEEGTSMVEVMVGLAMGMVVLAGLSMLLIIVVRGNARISARAEASDSARVTMTRIMEELHSACVSATLAPVKSTSTSAKLIFTRGTYGAATSANASIITTELKYSPTERILRENSTGSKERILLSNVGLPKSGNFFEYENPTSSFTTPTGAATLGTNAEKTILVRIAFKASPKSEPVADSSAATEISNSATLRLTPPTYRGETAKPCE